MLNRHHRSALRIVAVTAVMVVALGTLMGTAEHCGPLHGIYCTTGFATTAGCDLQLHGWQAYTLGELSMLLMIPLFAAVFSFFTSGITADHIDQRHDQMASHVTTTAGGGT